MKSIIVLGPPGSGKGTQAKKLAKKLKFFYFGMGDLMREEAKKGTALGRKFQAVWDREKGELVSEDLVQELVAKKLREIDLVEGIVFDGYPRTLIQKEMLEKALQKNNQLIVLNIEMPANLLIQRMETRRVCENCGKIFFKADLLRLKTCDKCGGKLIQRQEDKEETIKKRIAVYKEETIPLIEDYKKHGNLISIDGAPPIEEVTKEINSKILVGLDEY